MPTVTSKPPTFTTTVSVDWVDVDIEPEELEDAGWVYVGDQAPVTTEHVFDTVVRWHYEAHPDPWPFCRHPLCDALRGRPTG